MKKIISTLVAGLLVFSSVSAFAYNFEVKTETNFNYLYNNGVTTPTSAMPSCMTSLWAFDNNGNSSMTVVAGNKGTAESPDYTLDVASVESNDYLKFSTAYNNQLHVKFITDIMIKDDGGLRIKWKENANNSYTTEKSVIEFKADKKIIAYGSTSSVEATWEKNKWYNLSIIYERTTTTDGAPYVAELREGNASGKLLYTWIGTTGSASGSVTAGNPQVCFVTQSAVNFSLDNTGLYRGFEYDADGTTKNWNAPYTYTRQCFVADKAVVTDFASMQGKEVSAEFSVKDTSITATTPKLVIAAYDKDGRLQAANMCDIKLDDANLVSTSINVPADAASVKMFTWDFGAGLTPLLDPVVVEAAE